VVKADGLAAGKGVIVAMTEAEALPPSTTCSAAPSARPAPRW
jgi:phosphoribosylamine-glycine ligase